MASRLGKCPVKTGDEELEFELGKTYVAKAKRNGFQVGGKYLITDIKGCRVTVSPQGNTPGVRFTFNPADVRRGDLQSAGLDA